MIHNWNTKQRREAILPMVALSLVGLIGLLALAIDIGMIAISRGQCQNAADASAIAGIRTFNGDVSGSYNLPTMPAKAIGAAMANQVLGKNIQADLGKVSNPNAYTYKSGNVSIEAGAYTYKYNDGDPSQEGFKIQFPKQDATEPYTAVRSAIEYQSSLFFGRIFGATTTNTSATAVAVHRPRDVVIVMDLSGSMPCGSRRARSSKASLRSRPMTTTSTTSPAPRAARRPA